MTIYSDNTENNDDNKNNDDNNDVLLQAQHITSRICQAPPLLVRFVISCLQSLQCIVIVIIVIVIILALFHTTSHLTLRCTRVIGVMYRCTVDVVVVYSEVVGWLC